VPLDPFYVDRLPLLDGITTWAEGDTDPDVRRRLTAFGAPPDSWQAPQVPICDRLLPGPHGDVAVRIYSPAPPTAGLASPALVWVHGGGFMHGGLDMPEADAVAREIALRAAAVVVSVEYRLAVGGVHFPVPHDDVFAVVRWVQETAEELGVDPDRISLGGASAGANLAAGVALRLRDEGAAAPSRLLLAYPVVHPVLPPAAPALTEQMGTLPAVLRFSPEAVRAMNENYVGGSLDDASPYAMPGIAPLHDLPPTLVITSEYDDLRPSAEAFAAGCRTAGTQIAVVQEDGAVHGHLNHPSTDVFLRSVVRLAAAVGGGSIPPPSRSPI
jgi:acetyl esterase